MPPALHGRADTLASLRGALSSARLVTLVGPPGVGKTAVALAHARPRGGQVVEAADVGAVGTTGTLAAASADAFGLDPGDDSFARSLPPAPPSCSSSTTPTTWSRRPGTSSHAGSKPTTSCGSS